jgi:hypothetical protein
MIFWKSNRKRIAELERQADDLNRRYGQVVDLLQMLCEDESRKLLEMKSNTTAVARIEDSLHTAHKTLHRIEVAISVFDSDEQVVVTVPTVEQARQHATAKRESN